MNILKNLEAVVIGAVALTFVTAMATAKTPAAPVVKAAPVAVVVGDTNNMVTIVVTGTRLTAAQKKAGV